MIFEASMSMWSRSNYFGVTFYEGQNLRVFMILFEKANILFLSTFALIGCATRKFNAKKMLEAGLYNDASSEYEKILEEDPENVDAKIGLNAARSELWKKEFVSIRLLRMAGNVDSALERVESLLKRTSSWDVSNFSSGDLVGAQDEVRFAKRQLFQRVNKHLDGLKPLLAESELAVFPLVADSKVDGLRAQNMLEKIRDTASEQCKQIGKEFTCGSFSSFHFAKSYCEHFGYSLKDIVLSPELDYRFSSVVLAGEVSTNDRNFSSR